ncbi:MAG: hypothetical protein ABIJ45_12960, partial [Candidatus Zixiibacteriota bacterium]
MMKKLSLIVILIVFLAATVSAQLADKADMEKIRNDHLGLKPATSPFSLIDLSRVKWSNSYSVSFFSGGGNSSTTGLYVGSMFYELSNSLSLNLQLGIAHNPGALFNSELNSDARFYPAFNLDYHPSDKFRLSIDFQSVPAYYYGTDPRYNFYNRRFFE